MTLCLNCMRNLSAYFDGVAIIAGEGVNKLNEAGGHDPKIPATINARAMRAPMPAAMTSAVRAAGPL